LLQRRVCAPQKDERAHQKTGYAKQIAEMNYAIQERPF
jgi:hypothetical protein